MSAVMENPAALRQGSPEWLAYRKTKRNASDAAAMLGCSPDESRSALLHRVHTGIDHEVDAFTQRLFDEGHRAEALCRPLAEQLLDEDLAPTVVSKGLLSASLDGHTLMGDIDWEHKLLRDELRDLLPSQGVGSDATGDTLPLFHRVQIAHQQHCSGAKRTLFSASKWDDHGSLSEPARHCWVRRDEALIAQVLAGWAQFESDLAAYVPPEVVVPASAVPMDALPAVSVRLDGQLVVRDNLPAFGIALRQFIEKIPKAPTTDTEFATCDLACKRLKEAEDRLEATEESALASMVNVNTMRTLVAELRELARATRLTSEKLVAVRKTQIRNDEVCRGRDEFNAFFKAECERLGGPFIPPLNPDFGGAIKGLKTLDSVRDKINTLVANSKVQVSADAARADANLKAIAKENTPHLFPDKAVLVQKAPDDLAAIIAQRVAEDMRRKGEERARIAAEEAARIEREQAERARQEEAERIARAVQSPLAIPEGHTPPGTHSAPAAPNTLRQDSLQVLKAEAARPDATASDVPAVPTLKLGTMSERLGFTVSRAFIETTLGFTPSKVEKGNGLWSESAWPLICAALAEHVLKVGGAA